MLIGDEDDNPFVGDATGDIYSRGQWEAFTPGDMEMLGMIVDDLLRPTKELQTALCRNRMEVHELIGEFTVYFRKAEEAVRDLRGSNSAGPQSPREWLVYYFEEALAYLNTLMGDLAGSYRVSRPQMALFHRDLNLVWVVLKEIRQQGAEILIQEEAQ